MIIINDRKELPLSVLSKGLSSENSDKLHFISDMYGNKIPYFTPKDLYTEETKEDLYPVDGVILFKTSAKVTLVIIELRNKNVLIDYDRGIKRVRDLLRQCQDCDCEFFLHIFAFSSCFGGDLLKLNAQQRTERASYYPKDIFASSPLKKAALIYKLAKQFEADPENSIVKKSGFDNIFDFAKKSFDSCGTQSVNIALSISEKMLCLENFKLDQLQNAEVHSIFYDTLTQTNHGGFSGIVEDFNKSQILVLLKVAKERNGVESLKLLIKEKALSPSLKAPQIERLLKEKFPFAFH